MPLTPTDLDRIEQQNKSLVYDVPKSSIDAMVAEIRRLHNEVGTLLNERNRLQAKLQKQIDLSFESEIVRGTALVSAIAERDAILRWSIKYAGYIDNRVPTPDNPYPWWAQGDEGTVYADTPEAAVRKAAGLEGEPK